MNLIGSVQTGNARKVGEVGMNIGEIISALSLCASGWDDDKDRLLMVREIYSIEDKGNITQ